MKVVVIGSSNIDMVAQVSHLPAPGETVGDANFMQSLGASGRRTPRRGQRQRQRKQRGFKRIDGDTGT